MKSIVIILVILFCFRINGEVEPSKCSTDEDCFHLINVCTDVKCSSDHKCISKPNECTCDDSPYIDTDFLTKSTFDETIAEGVWFINFYAPWCGWCKRMNPVWENLSKIVHNRWHIAKVNCKEEEPFCYERFGINGYPTLRLFVNGKNISDHQLPKERKLGHFIRWVESKVNDLPIHIEKTCLSNQLEPIIKSDKPSDIRDGNVVVLSDLNFDATVKHGDWFIKFYAPWCGHCKKMTEVWKELAALGKYNIAELDCIANTETANAFSVHGYPTILLLRDGKLKDTFKGDRTIESLQKFLQDIHVHDEL